MSDSFYDELVQGWPDDLCEKFPPECFTHSKSTGSTNDDLLAKVRADEIRPFQTASADFQTKGRGRRGDKWEADAGENLLFSLALPLPENPDLWSLLPLVSAFLVGSELEAILPSDRIQIKWPNDIMCRDRKLGGILVETIVQEEPIAVVGIGLNLNMKPHSFPEELASIAISLYEILECESSRWYILGQILRGFISQYPDILIKSGSALAWIRERDFLFDREMSFLKEEMEMKGTGAGINDRGELLMKTSDGLIEPIISAHQIHFETGVED